MKLFLAVAIGSMIGSFLYGTTPAACVIYAVALGLAAVVVRFLVKAFLRVDRGLRDAGRVLKGGIPSPEQIRQEFITTMGREPTVLEVQALHQMATSRHNQAAMTLAVIGIGGAVGAYAIHREGGIL